MPQGWLQPNNTYYHRDAAYGQRAVGRGLWAEGCGQRAAGRGWRAEGGGLWADGGEQSCDVLLTPTHIVLAIPSEWWTMRMRRYQDLDVWKESIDLALNAYAKTASYPDVERYGLVSQTRRAAVSISCNIAEGQGRSQPGEFLNQLSVARGSLQEFETLCILAHRLGYTTAEVLEALLTKSDRISRMLTGLRKTLEGGRRKAQSPAQPHPSERED